VYQKGCFQPPRKYMATGRRKRLWEVAHNLRVAVHHTNNFRVADDLGAIREAPLSISRALRGQSEAVVSR